MPRAAAVCRQLDALAKPFARRSKSLVCTDQYGGPQQAVIAGTHRGSRVWVLIGMRNGCDISRAKRLAFLRAGLLRQSQFVTRAVACMSARWDRIAPVFRTGS